MTIGEKIRKSRKKAKVTAAELGALVGLSGAAISKIELDLVKNGPSPEMLINISDVLHDPSILTHALLENPICKRVIPRAFEPLNNINDNPSAILAKIQEEMEEGIEAAKILARNFSHADPENLPNHKGVLFANLEQILDVSRCIEEMFARLKACGALTEEEQLEIHIRQQVKVERNGHHISDAEVA